MIRIIDNHMIIYHNNTYPSMWFTLGSDSCAYGSWTYSCFNQGKFTAYETKFYIPAGTTITSSTCNGIYTIASSNSIIIKNICP